MSFDSFFLQKDGNHRSIDFIYSLDGHLIGFVLVKRASPSEISKNIDCPFHVNHTYSTIESIFTAKKFDITKLIPFEIVHLEKIIQHAALYDTTYSNANLENIIKHKELHDPVYNDVHYYEDLISISQLLAEKLDYNICSGKHDNIDRSEEITKITDSIVIILNKIGSLLRVKFPLEVKNDS